LFRRNEEKSIDLILCDLPYGTTDVKGWDKVIPANQMWEQYNRIIKDDGNIVLFGSQPFTSYLVSSNPSMFRYEWIWDKTRGANFLNANCQPMKSHENILVFSKLPTSPNKKGNAKYFPQKEGDEVYTSKLGKRTKTFNGGEVERVETELKGRHPKTIQTFKKDGKLHPTQKPVALCEFLINSYTNENDVVLDNCMGSGTTAIACVNTNRNFIGFELDESHFKVANGRILKLV
jgi:site-specific DNA-methyltransferase (adenine-specific)